MKPDNSLPQARLFTCLTDPARLKIMGLLAVKSQTVRELTTSLYMKSNRVLHNLNRLHEANLVRQEEKEGKVLYRLQLESLVNFNKETLSGGEEVTGPSDITDYSFEEQKILKTYIENGRLVSIPSKRKYRDVVLGWLVNKFRSGVKYPEKQVNEILSRYHPDVATLRREFIMTRLMKRENGGGCYWRI